MPAAVLLSSDRVVPLQPCGRAVRGGGELVTRPVNGRSPALFLNCEKGPCLFLFEYNCLVHEFLGREERVISVVEFGYGGVLIDFSLFKVSVGNVFFLKSPC